MGRPLVNSVTGEEDRLETILPLIKKYDVPVIAISNDETGISEDPDVRFAVAKKIVERADGLRHQAGGHRRRPAGHADRRDGHRRPAGVRAGPAAARGAEGQYELRRLEHLLRPAAPARHQRRLPADGDRLGHDLGDHEPLPPAGDGSGARRQRPDGHRPRLHDLDQDLPRLLPRARRDATEVGGERAHASAEAAASEGGRRRGGREARRGRAEV